MPRDNLKILVCSFSFPYFEGNVFDGKFVFAEAAAYAKNGAIVEVLTPHFPGAPFHETVESVEIFRFPYFFPYRWQTCKKPGLPIYLSKGPLNYAQFALLCLIFSFRILLRAPRIDLIHAQWTLPALLAMPAKWLFRKKIILTARGSDLRLLPPFLNRFIHRHIDVAIDCFGPQPWNRQYKANFPAQFLKLPLIVHHHPSPRCPRDLELLISKQSDPFVILYVGRFDRLKINLNRLPIVELIESAAAILARGYSNFHIVYLGDGDPEVTTEMTKLIRLKMIDDHVTLLGSRLNVTDYMHHCHLGLGGIAFNGVSQEFTICGIPQLLVKGLDNNDMPWENLRNTIFFDPDQPDALTNAIFWAILNRDKLPGIGKNAKSDMKEYITDSADGGARYLKAFHSLLSSRIKHE